MQQVLSYWRVTILAHDSALESRLREVFAVAGYELFTARERAQLLVFTDAGACSDVSQRIAALRGEGVTVPVLVLGETSNPQEVANVLNAGADDYMALPYDGWELLSRCHALLRRASGFWPQGYNLELQVDRPRRTVLLGGKRTQLRPLDFDLFVYLAERHDRWASEKEILSAVFRVTPGARSSRVRVRVHALRCALGEQGWVIEGRRGFGYRFSLRRPLEARAEAGADSMKCRDVHDGAGKHESAWRMEEAGQPTSSWVEDDRARAAEESATEIPSSVRAAADVAEADHEWDCPAWALNPEGESRVHWSGEATAEWLTSLDDARPDDSHCAAECDDDWEGPTSVRARATLPKCAS